MEWEKKKSAYVDRLNPEFLLVRLTRHDTIQSKTSNYFTLAQDMIYLIYPPIPLYYIYTYRARSYSQTGAQTDWFPIIIIFFRSTHHIILHDSGDKFPERTALSSLR